jgi:dihydroflavonol-4-reductase
MTSNKVVLVTGAAGYIAGHLVKQLLEQGYTVHGTVRSLKSKERYEYLYNLANASTNLKLFEADLSQEGAFDEAIVGTSIVFHTASPISLTLLGSTDLQRDMIDPAIQGTLNVLKSASKTATVRRVVITSSVVAISDQLYVEQSREKPFTEESWNLSAKVENGYSDAYCQSKVDAEKAAWNYLEHNKDKINFDIVIINPSLNYGPLLQEIKNPSEFNTSIFTLHNAIVSVKNGQPIQANGYAVVDVRDVARAHIVVAESKDPQVSNQRFIVSHSSPTFTELVQRVIDTYPDDFQGVQITTTGDVETGKKQTPYFDNTKLQKIIPSFKYTDESQTIADYYNNLKQLKLL